MNILVDKTPLLSAVDKAIITVSSRNEVPVLCTLLLSVDDGNVMAITGTDMEQRLECFVSCEEGSDTGKVLVPAQIFRNILSAMPNETLTIHKSTDDSKVSITCGDVSYSIGTWSVDDFPLQTEKKYKTLTMKTGDLQSSLIQSGISLSSDETRPALCGTALQSHKDGVIFASTDGRRLSFCTRSFEAENSTIKEFAIIIGTKALKTIAKLLKSEDIESNITLGISKDNLLVEYPGWRLQCRLIDGNYPNYMQIIPTGECTKLTLSKRPLITAVERASIILQGSGSSVKMFFSQDQIHVSSSNDTDRNFEESIPLEVELESDFKLAFNPDFLLDGLKACPSKEVELQYFSNAAPVIISCDTWEYILMPMRN